MGIVFESSTPIEFRMRKALTKEGIPFTEQYRINTGEKFSEVKYVADFFVQNDNIRLLIECDGFTYHHGKGKQQRERDAWLNCKGYRVLHFSTNDIKYRMDDVIACIKLNLLSQVTVPFAPSKAKEKRSIPPARKEDHRYDVILYCYYRQIWNSIYVVYMYKDMAKNIMSDQRIKVCHDVPHEQMASAALFLALSDLKRPVSVKISFNGHVHNEFAERIKTIRTQLSHYPTDNMALQASSFFLAYANLEAYPRGFGPDDVMQVLSLKKKCLQVTNTDSAQRSSDFSHYEYSEIIKKSE